MELFQLFRKKEKGENFSEKKIENRNESRYFWKEFGKIIFISLLIVVPFRIFIAQPFIVDGASMDPTFETGDYLIVDELSYFFTAPERGSVIIFKYPIDPRKSFIKRVIGLPGETVIIENGTVIIKNADHPDGFILDEPYVKSKKIEMIQYTLSEDEYFVMGDNRISSADSRSWGPLPEKNIIGRPILRALPPTLFPGDYSRSYNNSDTSLKQ